MDEQTLRELLRSPLDDQPPRRSVAPFLVGAGVVLGVIVLGVAAVSFVGGGGDEPEAVVATNASEPADEPTGDVTDDTAPSGTAATTDTAVVTTIVPVVVATEGAPDVGGMPAMAATGPAAAVMFGGGFNPNVSGVAARGDVVDELWALDLDAGAWRLLEPDPELPGPAARVGGTMEAIGDGGEVMVFGGSASALFFCSPVPLCSGNLLDDTWVYEPASGTWVEAPSVPAPPARVGHATAFDTESGVVVLFGGAQMEPEGFRNGTAFGDTWAWSVADRTWRQMAPPESPDPRSYHAMAYDPELDLVVLWGGDEPDEGDNDNQVWGYDVDADEWTLLGGGEEAPQAPWYHRMAYVPELGEIVVVGGWVTVTQDLGQGVTATSVGPTDDVWALDAATAAFRRLTPLPEPSSQVGLAPVAGGLVVYDHTWTLRYDAVADAWDNITVELGGSIDG